MFSSFIAKLDLAGLEQKSKLMKERKFKWKNETRNWRTKNGPNIKRTGWRERFHPQRANERAQKNRLTERQAQKASVLE